MVNKANINKVIAAIRDEDNHFDMSEWTTDCGTAACIGGHCDAIGGYTIEPGDIGRGAAEWLGIKETQFYVLFYMADLAVDKVPNRLQAITTLENLRDTGKVDWSHVG